MGSREDLFSHSELGTWTPHKVGIVLESLRESDTSTSERRHRSVPHPELLSLGVFLFPHCGSAPGEDGAGDRDDLLSLGWDWGHGHPVWQHWGPLVSLIPTPVREDQEVPTHEPWGSSCSLTLHCRGCPVGGRGDVRDREDPFSHGEWGDKDTPQGGDSVGVPLRARCLHWGSSHPGLTPLEVPMSLHSSLSGCPWRR